MKRVLILGAGPAGLGAAQALAGAGCEVCLVEKEKQIGGQPARYTCKALEACVQCGACLSAELAAAVKATGIRILTQTTVRSALIGDDGRWRLLLAGSEGEEILDADAVIVTTGHSVIAPSIRQEFRHGASPRVLTALELEHGLFDKPDWEAWLGPLPQIAMVQCFGSRDINRGVAYCSRACCFYANRLARRIADSVPGAAIDLYCMDRQQDPSGEMPAEPMGLTYIRANPARVDLAANGTAALLFDDPECGGPRRETYDWIVLCPAMVPGPGQLSIAARFGLPITETGFFVPEIATIHEPPVIAAGTATGPMTILESIESGRSAAFKVLRSLTA
ncbi:MAG: NAD(P)-binding protein [Solirubrobacterales bacterium]